MGKVYLAEHCLMRREVALKVLSEKYAEDRSVVERFLREVQNADRTNHPNIVTVYDSGWTEAGLPYLTMELLRGSTLEQVLRRDAPLPAARIRHILRQICAGLRAAHRRGLIHRDLKPGNLFLIEREGDPDFVKILDFGIAKRLSTEDGDLTALTVAGSILGTPAYMAPEQARSGIIDARTDVYALGCILYEMLAGRPPFVGNNIVQLITQLMFEPITPPSRYASIPVASDLERICFKALQKKAEDRFQSVDELEKEIGEEPSGELRSWRSAPALVGLAIVLLGCLSGLYFLTRSRPTPERLPEPAIVAPPPTPSASPSSTLSLTPEQPREPAEVTPRKTSLKGGGPNIRRPPPSKREIIPPPKPDDPLRVRKIEPTGNQ